MYGPDGAVHYKHMVSACRSFHGVRKGAQVTLPDPRLVIPLTSLPSYENDIKFLGNNRLPVRGRFVVVPSLHPRN